MTHIKRYKYSYIWIVLGVSAVIVNQLMSYAPAIVDKIYFRGVFQMYRLAYDHTLGFLPFPMVYVGLVVFIVIAGRIFSRLIEDAKVKKWKSGISRSLIHLSALLSGSLFLFYILWGFNYNRPDIYSQLDMNQPTIDSFYLFQEVDRVTHQLIKARLEVTTDTISALSSSYIPKDMESLIRQDLESILMEWDIPTYGRVRVRKLHPKGLLLRFSTAGVYVPYAMEGHIDGGLHPIQWPFTMAHEMTHGYGYGDEGTCNFIGYLTCLRSDVPIIRYSGVRGYWRYLMSDIRRISPAKYREIWYRLPQSIQADIQEIIAFMDLYPDIMPDVRNLVYDSYLKSHGIKDGMSNYSHMIRYVKAYKERN